MVFRQTMPFLWERDQDLAVNALDPSHQNFSILQCLDGCRGPDGAYNLMYRDLEHQGQWVAWSQSSNPAAEETATDVRVLHWGPSLSAADGKFGGLVRSSKRPCLMHSSSGSGSWWYYAVGTYAKWQGAIPGIQQAPSVATSSVELLVGLSPDGARDLIAQVAGGFERPSPGLSDPGALGQLQAAVEADLKARGVELKNVKIDLPNRQLSLLREVQFDRNSSVFTSPRDAHALLSEVATIVDVCNDQLSKRSGGLIGLLLEGHTTAGSRLRKLADARAQACADYLMDKLAGLKPPEGVDPATLIQSTGITKSDRMAVVVHVTAPGFNSTGSRAGGRRKR